MSNTQVVPEDRVGELTRDVADLWEAYQASRFGYVTGRLPWLLARAHASAESRSDDRGAQRLLGLSYQLAAVQLTKLEIGRAHV